MKLAAWYAKELFFRPQNIKANNLAKTHAVVRIFEAADLEDGFRKMQGEIWSPNGEMLGKIIGLCLQHTSMSVGDVFHVIKSNSLMYPKDSFWQCMMEGWAEIRE